MNKEKTLAGAVKVGIGIGLSSIGQQIYKCNNLAVRTIGLITTVTGVLYSVDGVQAVGIGLCEKQEKQISEE